MSDTTVNQDADVVFPEITVQLSGEDANGFLIACRVRSAIERHAKKTRITPDMSTNEQIAARATIDRLGEMFFEEALSGNYQHVIATCMRWVRVR